MPRFLLSVRATLENLEEVIFDKNSIVWCLDVHDGTGAERREKVTVSPADSVPVEGSRGEAHFAVKWSGSKRQATLSLTEEKNVTRDCIRAEDSEQWVPLVALECRGLEPDKVHTPQHGIRAISAKGTVFEKLTFEDGSWSDYCEKAAEPVSILDLSWKISRL